MIVYDANGNFQCVTQQNPDGSTTSFGPGSPQWDAYVAQNGVPPATGTPTFPPAPLPAAVQNAISTLKAYANNATPSQAQMDAAIKAQLVIDRYLFVQLGL